MIRTDRQSGEGPSHHIAALRDSIVGVREREITPPAVATLFRTSHTIAQDVMRLDQVASTVFAMRFGSAIVSEAKAPYTASLQHKDGSESTFALITHSGQPDTVSNYLNRHFNFNPLEYYRNRGKLTDELRSRFLKAGIATNYLDGIAHVALNMASDITPFDVFLQHKGSHGIDDTKLTVPYFKEQSERIPSRPDFVVDEDMLPEFMSETGKWLHGRFEEVLDNVTTGKYLLEQELH